MNFVDDDFLPSWRMEDPHKGAYDSQIERYWEVLGGQSRELESLLDDYIEASFDSFPIDLVLLASHVLEKYRVVHHHLLGLAWSGNGSDDARMKFDSFREEFVNLETVEERLATAIVSKSRSYAVQSPPGAEVYGYWLTTNCRSSNMSTAEEELLAELPSNSSAWLSLYEECRSKLTASYDGEVVPVSSLRPHMSSQDPHIRRAAHAGFADAWRSMSTVASACLNSIIGERSTVSRRRQSGDPLQQSLLQNGISESALSLLHSAVEECLPSVRSFLSAKAALLQPDCSQLHWADVAAPLPSDPVINWVEAESLIVEALTSISADFGDHAKQAFRESWIDAAPRSGKRLVGTCLMMGGGTSAILVNFDKTADDVLGVAHEIGHSFHHWLLRERPEVLRRYPLNLAETISMIAEDAIISTVLDSSLDALKAAFANAAMISCTQVVAETYSRFLFEREVFTRRTSEKFSVEELTALLFECQRSVFGDSISSESLPDYRWIAQPHYYSESYSNWPYYFAHLVASGHGDEHWDSGAESWGSILGDTGCDSASNLLARIGIDVESAGQWRAGVDRIGQYASEFGLYTSRYRGGLYAES